MRGFALVLSSALLTSVPAAPAAVAPEPLEGLAVLASQPWAGPALADRLAGQLEGGSPTAVLRAMLRSLGHDEAPLPLAAAGAPAGAPPGLAGPLGILLGAAGAAEALRAEALAGLSVEERALLLQGVQRAAPLASHALPSAGAARVARLGSGPLGPDPAAEALAAKVDAAKLRVAALTLLAAVEASAPALRVLVPAEEPRAHCPGVTGTIVFEAPNCAVLVGGTGPNAYASPASPLLLVDLGGNDVYTNRPGVATGSVRIVVDVAGDDTYSDAASAAAAGAAATSVAAGHGALGVGLVADLGGNDVYTSTASTTAPQPGPVAGTATARGLGSAMAGAGVLLDLGGRDRFHATASSSGGIAIVEAQGQATAGLGALLNLGREAGIDDAYVAAGLSTLHLVKQEQGFQAFEIGPAAVAAQAASSFAGAGLLADAGGNDDYDALPKGGVALAHAQGATLAGAALLLEGLGDDTLDARAIGDTTLSLVTTDPSFCWEVEVFVDLGQAPTLALAQGAALPGVAALVDAAGKDTRVAQGSSHAGAIARATSGFDCSVFGGNRATATAISGPGTAQAQGSAVLGLGALLDLEGNDANTLLGASSALAEAIAVSPGPDVESATATAGPGQTLGQGQAAQLSAGVLADALGSDAYSSAASSAATRTTSAGTTVAPGPTPQSVQGHGVGTSAGWLLELNGSDAYATSPPVSLAGNNKCWTHGSSGRGRDVSLVAVLPFVCL